MLCKQCDNEKAGGWLKTKNEIFNQWSSEMQMVERRVWGIEWRHLIASQTMTAHLLRGKDKWVIGSKYHHKNHPKSPFKSSLPQLNPDPDDSPTTDASSLCTGPSHLCFATPFPFPFPLAIPKPKPNPSAPWWALSKLEIRIGASHIRIVWSSEHDANILSFLGFQATEFTLPSPCPVNSSNRIPDSRCHIYTLLSVIRVVPVSTVPVIIQNEYSIGNGITVWQHNCMSQNTIKWRRLSWRWINDAVEQQRTITDLRFRWRQNYHRCRQNSSE